MNPPMVQRSHLTAAAHVLSLWILIFLGNAPSARGQSLGNHVSEHSANASAQQSSEPIGALLATRGPGTGRHSQSSWLDDCHARFADRLLATLGEWRRQA